ncbi:MAG: glycosyltransferase family 4 protein [Paludibacteraceae bacterium]|nr:glycosyltransferase family 4 protein [Paludibacteraceae bacterium]
MKILIIHRSFALIGGAERVITDKANYLAEKGHQLMLVSYEQGLHPLPFELQPSVQYKDLDCRFFTLSKYSMPKHLYYFFWLKRKFRKNLRITTHDFNPDVVVLASDWQLLMDAVINSVSPVPVIAEFHNTYSYIIRKIGVSDGWFKTRLTQLYYRQTIKKLGKGARLVVLTESDARDWRQHFKNVIVIHNPVTLYPDVIDDLPKDYGRIIFVGRFNHEKRIDRLITAFSIFSDNYKDWHVDIFGDGNEKENLLRQIKELRLEGRVIIHKPTKTIYDEYKRSEMLVLCSEHEASPLVLVEAMACGVPCVSMDCPNGPREIIQDGETGLLVENGNVDDLAHKMEWLITHDKEREEMGKKARLAALAYKPSVIMKEWEKLYTGPLSK